MSMGILPTMLTLPRRALAPFPEPAVVFDLDDETVVLVNERFSEALADRGSPLTVDTIEQKHVKDVAEAGDLQWPNAAIQPLLDGASRSEGVYSDAFGRWVITSRMRELTDGTRYALVTMHERDEGQAWLSHTRLRSLMELALYLADARHDNVAALQTVQANYMRLQTLEESFGHLIEDFMSHTHIV